MSSNSAALHDGPDDTWRQRARYFNSGNAFALVLSAVPSVTFIEERDRAFDPGTGTGLIMMDSSEALETPFPATTPLLLSRYARIRAGEGLDVAVRASAQLFCVLAGDGTTTVDGETARWKAGDVLALPGGTAVHHRAETDAVAWLVTDEPALAFLDLDPVAPDRGAMRPVHFRAEELAAELEAVYRHPDADRFPGYAVVLSHTGLEHTRNIHPTMTLALNSLPAGRSQRAHVHSAVALTLCLQGEGCHSMVDGERKDWSRHAVMVTPPGAVHSHHNEGTGRMESLVVQDGGLHYHARTTGFAYAD
ncbi:MAG: cupin domain-containing protein [Gammaproteobacteria bacterium]|nr:cupin domain-containing protein [Gammaproteobacteria bacterium]